MQDQFQVSTRATTSRTKLTFLTSTETCYKMKLYICTLVILLVSSLQSNAFSIGEVEKDPAALAHKLILELSFPPVVTEVSPGTFHVKVGQREPVVASVSDADTGIFSHRTTEGMYQNNEDVVYLVNPQTAGAREILFTHFNTEKSYDYLSVFVWKDNQFVLGGRYSGTVGPFSPLILAPEGRFLLSFTSDGSVTKTGFTVAYTYKASVQEKHTQ